MDLKTYFNFPWPLLRVALEGTSIIDVPRLEIHGMEEATQFIRSYGFDPNSTDDVEMLWGFFDEAVQFIERSLNDPKYAKVPDHLRTRESVRDLRRLLLMASAPDTNSDQVFSCALLRLMHVLIHLAFDPRLRFFDQVRTHVLEKLDPYLFVDPASGATYLGKKGDPTSIKLLFFKKKDRKDREREIIKLLHKSDNLVEEIYDRIGFRLVTETRFDAVRTARLLLDENIISVPNVRPGRSRNRLVDLKRLRFEVDRIAAHLSKSKEPLPYIDRMIRRLEKRIGPRRLGRSLINPHSSEHFRAFQFTGRVLVKIRNPLSHTLTRLQQELANVHGVQQILNEIFPKWPAPFEYVFFPFEVQIMDVKSYADSIFGKSNHEEYRKKQREAARDRVFGRGESRTDSGV